MLEPRNTFLQYAWKEGEKQMFFIFVNNAIKLHISSTYCVKIIIKYSCDTP